MGSNTENLALSVAQREDRMPAVLPGFGSLQSFELMQRQAKMLSSSTLVPSTYQAQTPVKEYGKIVGWEPNPNALPNCIIALNMSQRLGADVLMVMQNLYVVEGRPSWSSQFIAAAINASGRFSPLRYELSAPGETEEVTYEEVEWKGGNKSNVIRKIKVTHRECYAWAIDKASGDKIVGPTVSIRMALDEKWIQKRGSKWQTMPEIMLHYRATSFFGKLHAPDLLMGLQTREELEDVGELELGEDGVYTPKAKAEKARNAVPSAIEAALSRAAEQGQPAAAAEPQEDAPPADPASDTDDFVEQMRSAEREIEQSAGNAKPEARRQRPARQAGIE